MLSALKPEIVHMLTNLKHFQSCTASTSSTIHLSEHRTWAGVPESAMTLLLIRLHNLLLSVLAESLCEPPHCQPDTVSDS